MLRYIIDALILKVPYRGECFAFILARHKVSQEIQKKGDTRGSKLEVAAAMAPQIKRFIFIRRAFYNRSRPIVLDKMSSSHVSIPNSS